MYGFFACKILYCRSWQIGDHHEKSTPKRAAMPRRHIREAYRHMLLHCRSRYSDMAYMRRNFSCMETVAASALLASDDTYVYYVACAVRPIRRTDLYVLSFGNAVRRQVHLPIACCLHYDSVLVSPSLSCGNGFDRSLCLGTFSSLFDIRFHRNVRYIFTDFTDGNHNRRV